MIKRWLSSYSLRYPRVLVYMLQASEYFVFDYLKWYWQVKDFRTVERRKAFVSTSKSVLLLGLVWALLVALYATSIACLFFFLPLGILLFLLTPMILAYAILVPLLAAEWFIQRPITAMRVRRARETLARHPGVKIAIAGSYGKTSMREILKTVLSAGKRVAAPGHSYNTPLAISQFVQTLKGDEEVLIFELGEYYPGDVRSLCKLVQPSIGVITGVNEAHLEKMKTLEATTGTIFEIAEFVKPEDLYVNGENALAATRANAANQVYTRDGLGNLSVTEATTGLNGTSFVIHGEHFVSGLLGLHQVGPLIAAIDIARRLGVDSASIQHGVEQTAPFEHRLEPKKDTGGVITLDDSYNGNPDGVRAVIAFLRSLTGHRRWYVTPGLVEAGDRVEIVHREIGRELAEAGIEKVVLVRNSVTPFIEQGLCAANFSGDLLWYDDAIALFSALPHMTVAGDVVLLQNDWPDQYR